MRHLRDFMRNKCIVISAALLVLAAVIYCFPRLLIDKIPLQDIKTDATMYCTIVDVDNRVSQDLLGSVEDMIYKSDSPTGSLLRNVYVSGPLPHKNWAVNADTIVLHLALPEEDGSYRKTTVELILSYKTSKNPSAFVNIDTKGYMVVSGTEHVAQYINAVKEAMERPAGENLPQPTLADTQYILTTYEKELGLVEQVCGHPIEEITEDTRKEMASVANRYLYDPDYRFSALMTEIARASTQNSANVQVWREYDAITGQFIASLSASAPAASDSVTLSVPAELFPGVDLEGTSVHVPYSFSGPVQGETLHNGLNATHSYACAVMFGTVMREGENYYYIADVNGEAFSSYVGMTASGSLYVDAGADGFSTSGFWETPNDFKEKLVTNPGAYLRGDSLDR